MAIIRTHKNILGVTAKALLPLSYFLISTLYATSAHAETTRGAEPDIDAGAKPLTQVYWGDTHLHTNMSVDANGLGNRNLTPDDAYRFARGEAIVGHNGVSAQLSRPLDFIVVADHAVNMGVLPALRSHENMPNEPALVAKWLPLMANNPADVAEFTRQNSKELFLNALKTAWPNTDAGFFWESWTTDYFSDTDFRRQVWSSVCDLADKYNTPEKFTAFIGYEWTPSSASKKSPNFHRNIIFEGDKSAACSVLPFSVQDSENVEQLWAYLADYEKTSGSKVLAIPHNGNLSSGKMFKLEYYSGDQADTHYAEMRARWEPLYEVTQIKGDSEAHPSLSPSDYFADFETWHRHGFYGELPEDFVAQKRYEYARPALKLGLEAEKSLGINPLKFGMIGSSDAHTSLSAVAEDNFWGKVSLFEPSALRLSKSWHYSASGLAAVWSENNTRSSLFNAMQRKEVYATTGTRIALRFFGGWEFTSGDEKNADAVADAYALGVPMGGDLPKSAPATKNGPRFLIMADKDPEGANLDRIQIVKGWIGSDGKSEERIYNVALAANRKGELAADGVRSVGSTVDVSTATYSNAIGEPQLYVFWQDPDFDSTANAFYYARVLEIPTPRWNAFDRLRFGLNDEDLVITRPFGPPGTPQVSPMIVQERAYSSPIWYSK